MAQRKKDTSSEGKLSSNPASLLKLRDLVSKKLKIDPVIGQYGPHPVVSTGSFVIDSIIGGTASSTGEPICPGFPRKKITEIFGNESCGKTTVCLNAIAKEIKNGGTAVYLDFEHALDHSYANKIGVDFDKCLLYAPTTMEEGLMIAKGAIAMGVDIVVVDSLAAMVPADELAKNLDDNAKVGAVAKKLAETLPKFALWLESTAPPGSKGTAMVWINQMRALISTGPSYGGDDANVNTAGGKALKFYCSLRLKLNKVRTENVDKTDPITGKKKSFSFGNVVECRIVKNKVNGTQGHRGNFFIRYGYGIDEIRTVIEAAATNGVVKRSGPSYTLGGNSFKGQEALRKFFLSNPGEYEAVYALVQKAVMDAAPAALSDEDMDEEDEISEAMSAGFGEPAHEEVNPSEDDV